MPGPSQPAPDEEHIDGGEEPYSPTRDPTVLVLLVIVFGSVLAMVVGLGGPAVVGGNDSGPVFPIPEWFDGDGDDAAAVELRVDANRSTVRPGDAVAFTVSTADGSAVDNATVRVAGRVHAVTNGTTAVRFDAGGEYVATASGAMGGDVDVVGAETTITVERYVTNLSLAANATGVTAGDAVRFTVTDGSDPIDATVVVGGTQHTADGGTAVVTFERAGEFEADARKGQTPTRRYRSDALDVDVQRRQVALSVALNDSDPVAHEPFRVRVTRADSGDPAGATVAFAGETYDTGHDGVVNITVDAVGEFELRATLAETPAIAFVPAERTVGVDRRHVALSIAANRTGVPKGEAIRFTLTRADTGAGVNGTLTADGDTYRTDLNGTATVTFDDPGRLFVRGGRADTATETFERASVIVSVRGANYSLSAFDAPDEATRGERVTVSVNVTNDGNEPGSEWLEYRFDGDRRDREYVALDPGESRPVAFEATIPNDTEPGTYRHAVVAADGTVAGTLAVTAANGTTTNGTASDGTAAIARYRHRSGSEDSRTVSAGDETSKESDTPRKTGRNPANALSVIW
ncbi:COG1361 family protein [Halostella salina]|uniref:hypothetical protein n=1 Tax=Halostella salina TaxID=1547897 RepID=UPI000EF8256F|nr:hypothetical protein [Halostella salina]